MPGHDTVGTHVNVAHLAAAPIGMTVTFTAEVIRVDGRRVEFKVEAFDEKEKIGEGTHERAIINIAKFAARLAEKSRDVSRSGHVRPSPRAAAAKRIAIQTGRHRRSSESGDRRTED